MSSQLGDDLNDILTAFYEHIKEHSMLKAKLRENEKYVELLKTEVVEARKAEKRAFSNLKRVQENLVQLQKIASNLTTVKEENLKLKKDIAILENLLETERKNFLINEQKWNDDKESIIENSKEELENMKKIRNMEVVSLNREMNRIQEENIQKMEDIKRNSKKLESEYKQQLSETVNEYEEKLKNLNRDLVAAKNEVKNLRQLTNNGMISYNVDLGLSKNDRYIPQPISFARYKPLPVVSTASQLYSAEHTETDEPQNTTPEHPQTKMKADTKKSSSGKKRKLYSRADDSFLY